MKNYKIDFHFFSDALAKKDYIYFDSASTTQKPRCVIDKVTEYYQYKNANVHRGVYALSHQATEQYELVREKVQKFMGAAEQKEIIFTNGATAAMNLLAHSFAHGFMRAGDEVILTEMEHHSNIVPWQILRDTLGIVIKVLPVTAAGELDIAQLPALMSPRTKILACMHVSNVLGTINPVKELIEIAHRHGVKVFLDGVQSVPHMPVDMQKLDCDFYAFSAHKMYGPTGVGVLYGKAALLEKMPVYQGGGSMISSVSFERTTYADLPLKFEAGTPNIAGVIGMGAAIDYLNAIGMDVVDAHEMRLLDYATRKLSAIEGVRIVGTSAQKVGVISFVMDGLHPHDVATVLDTGGIAARAGHHCAMPLMKRFNLPAVLRISFGLYNDEAEIDRLVVALARVKQVLSVCQT